MWWEILQEIIKATIGTDSHSNKKEVICFSPLEASSTKTRSGGLVNESLKIKRLELSQKITYALIPALILISKSSLTTSLLIFSVYWQIYGYFKEISLDYVHQDVGFGVFKGAAFDLGQGYYSRLWFGVISLWRALSNGIPLRCILENNVGLWLKTVKLCVLSFNLGFEWMGWILEPVLVWFVFKIIIE